MKYTPFLVGLTLLVHTAFSQVVTNPVADFLSRHTDPSKGELFPGESWNGRSEGQPPGGYLLRFEAPIGPNGSPVLFIAASILADLRTSTWDAYTCVIGQGYALAADNLTFGAIPRFYLLKPGVDGNRGLAEIFADKIGYSVSTYSLDKVGHLKEGSLGGIARDQDKEYDNPKFEDEEMSGLKKKYGLFQSFTPKIEKILLGEYLKSPLTKWRPFNAAMGVDSQHADPSESEAVKQDGLSKAEASSLLKAEH